MARLCSAVMHDLILQVIQDVTGDMGVDWQGSKMLIGWDCT